MKTANAEEEKLLKAIMSGVKFIQLNVSNIMSFSRVQSDTTKGSTLNEDYFGLSDALDTIVSFLQETANAKQVFIEIACDLIAMIKADKSKILQVVINLISNAVKFAPKRSVVRVDAIYDEVFEELTIRVTDNGPGISEEDQAKLFKPFGVIKKTMSLNPNGTGLGLFICKKLCEEMDGSIKCKSTRHETTFSLTIKAQMIKPNLDTMQNIE